LLKEKPPVRKQQEKNNSLEKRKKLKTKKLRESKEKSFLRTLKRSRRKP